MNCPGCSKEVVADKVFCIWCESFIPEPKAGVKAGIFRRWLAAAMDPGIAIVSYVLLVSIFGGITRNGNGIILIAILLLLAYAVFYLKLLSMGMTPGKYIMGERVVDKLTGNQPGLGTMLLREIIGKMLSAAVFGMGFFWALFDKDNQAWHDKLAGTVVIKKR